MTEPTAVAVTPPKRASILPPEIQAALELRKAQNLVAAQIAALNWGKNIDLDTRRAVGEWGRKHNVDVTTEIDVLGQNIYLNARYYLRRLSDLVEAGLVEYAVDDYVQADGRLAKLGTPEALREEERRTMERIKWGIPEAEAVRVGIVIEEETSKTEALVSAHRGVPQLKSGGANAYEAEGLMDDPEGAA